MRPASMPLWILLAPLVALTAMAAGPPEHRLWGALPAAIIFAAMQCFIPKCRFRTDNYFSPVNVALFLMFLKLIAAPALIMTVGPESPVLSSLPSTLSMEGALAIDTIAYVALCLGLAFATPAGRSCSIFDLPNPSPTIALLFALLGILGFAAEFGSPARLIEYFLEPSALTELRREAEGTLMGLAGTFLRPFLAFSLVAWWTRVAGRNSSISKITATGAVAALGIALANMTFNFNRAAFVFPLVTLAAVYHDRIRRIPLAFTMSLAAFALPILLMVSTYRSNLMMGSETSADSAWRAAGESISENVQGYAVGPQYTGLFYDELGWGRQLYFGQTLIASVMSPVPVLGKGFRQDSGPALFNRALYGIDGIEDQILPFDAELFANFHLPGVALGLAAVGFLLAKSEQWIASATSGFAAFSVQYAAIWGAMLAAWSISIYSQILIYFFAPVYLYIFLSNASVWLRSWGYPKPYGELAR